MKDLKEKIQALVESLKEICEDEAHESREERFGKYTDSDWALELATENEQPRAALAELCTYMWQEACNSFTTAQEQREAYFDRLIDERKEGC